MRKTLFLFFLALLSSSAPGQRAAYRAPLDSVPRTAFYKIPLGPDLTPLLDLEMEKLRIRSKGQDIPFIVRKKDQEGMRTPPFRSFDIQDRKEVGGWGSIIFERPKNDSIEKLTCYTERPDRLLRFKIHGSEKRNEWKLMRKGTVRSSVKDTTSSEFHIPSPLGSGHRLYRLRTKRSSGKEANVISIGNREKDPPFSSAYRELPMPKFQQKEKAEKSLIRVQLDTARRVDRIFLKLKGPPFFRRNCEVGIPKKTEEEPFAYDPIGGTVLSDTIGKIENLDPCRTDHLLLSIEKGPDPPLKLNAIRLFQRRRSILAHLEKGKSYRLYLGGDLQDAPSYELRNYRDRIPEKVPQLGYGEIKRLSPSSEHKKKENERRDLVWIWGAIVLAILLIGAITIRMVMDEGRKKGNANSSLPGSDNDSSPSQKA